MAETFFGNEVQHDKVQSRYACSNPSGRAESLGDPTVAEELRNDVRFALGWKIGEKLRPITDVERDMVAAIVEHIRLCNWRVERGPPRGLGLRSWGGVVPAGATRCVFRDRGPATLTRARCLTHVSV